MASYRYSAKIVSRGQGQNVIAKAAYNAREDLRDERTGEMKRHGERPGLEFSGIFAPKDAPEWAHDRAQLWNAVERREDEQPNKKNRDEAQLARSLELNFPHELDADQRRQLVRDFVREQFVRRGMIADVAIHTPDEHSDKRNIHAHILLTMREITPDGFGAKVREWNDRQLHATWREKWAELGARYLEKIPGCELEAERYKVAHLSLGRQRQAALERGDLTYAETLDREPTKHLGPGAAAMERKGITTDRGDVQRESVTAQQETAKLKRELAEVEKQIAAVVERETRGGAIQERPQPVERPQPERISQALDFTAAARETTATPPPRTASGDTLAERATQIIPRMPANDNFNFDKVGPVLTRGVDLGIGLSVRAASIVFGTVANAFESLLAPGRTPTIQEMRAENERQVAAGAERDPALEKFIRDEEFEYYKKKRDEQVQDRQTAQRDYYERQKRDERER